jgi:hypothetical protein
LGLTQEPQDIQDADDLYRRIAPAHVNPDGTINSGAFTTRRGEGLSVNLARLTTPEETLRPRPTFGLGSLKAAIPTGLGLNVRHAPSPHNHAHSLIEGQNTRAIRRQMAEAAVLFISPDPDRIL